LWYAIANMLYKTILVLISLPLSNGLWFWSKKCKLSEWGTWSTCNSSCGDGNRIRKRVKLSDNGKKCELIQVNSCNNGCCPVDCVYTWGPWTACSGSCGSNGQKESFRKITQDKKCGGKCDVSETRTMKCDTGR